MMFWIPAVLIFLAEGVMTALTSQSEMAVQGITSLGYPIYFGNTLAVFKVIGAVALVLPMVKGNYKEWVFAGFGIDFICAFISLVVVGGFSAIALFPLIMFALLVVAHIGYHKMNSTV